MFKKVLIAEDHETASISIRKVLDELSINNIAHVYYCDDAYSYVKKALKDNEPYDLLISDLNFDEDYQIQELKDGAALIKAIKTLQPEIRTLVFSAEQKASIIQSLFDELGIDAYVRKARYDVAELKNALQAVEKGQKYWSAGLKQTLKEKNTFEFTAYDTQIISLLAQGTFQKDIPQYLQAQQIKPAGLSSVEKRLNLIRDALGFTKNEQLVVFCRDLGVI